MVGSEVVIGLRFNFNILTISDIAYKSISDIAYYGEIALTDLPETNTAGRMGRPPMNVKPTVVRLTQEALDRIEKVAGPNQRAAFIRQAVENELERREALHHSPIQTDADDGNER